MKAVLFVTAADHSTIAVSRINYVVCTLHEDMQICMYNVTQNTNILTANLPCLYKNKVVNF